MEMMMMMVPLIAVFYFFMIRPEQKRKRQAAELLASLATGDEIVTSSGIVGKIVHINEEFVTFETSEDRVRIKVLRSSVVNKRNTTPEA